MDDKDTIYRQAAIDEFDGVKVDEEYCTEYDIGFNDGIDFAISKLSVLPSAQPDCSDCIKHGGDWDCDHVHCHKGESVRSRHGGNHMRLIDADVLIDDIRKHSQSYFADDFAHEWVDKQPTVDAVEVVRCKECIHQQKVFHEDKRIKEGGYYICGCELADGYSVVCLDADFCSRGKRRSDE